MTDSSGRPPAPPWAAPGGGYPGYPGYPAPPYPYPTPPPYYPGFAAAPPANRNGLGVASLVVAIGGLVTALSVIGGVVLGGIAVLLGLLGHGRVKRREADNGAVAIAGIVLGVLAMVAGIACTVIYVNIWRTVGGDDYVDCMTKAGSDSARQQQCTDRFREHFENKLGGTLAPPTPDLPGLQPGSGSGGVPA